MNEVRLFYADVRAGWARRLKKVLQWLLRRPSPGNLLHAPIGDLPIGA